MTTSKISIPNINNCCQTTISTTSQTISITPATSTTTTTNTIPYFAYFPSFLSALESKNDNKKDQITNKKNYSSKDITMKLKDPNNFKKVEILRPNKVIRFTFEDDTVIKTICEEEDTFDFEFAFYIALAKKFFKKCYTPEGILHKAKEFSYEKSYVKRVKQGIKLYYKQEKEKEDAKKREKELKEIKERQKAKRQRQKARAKQRRINDLTIAIKKANE